VTEIVQWLIRNNKGEIDGPLTTVEVIRKIRSGKYLGEEYISSYPSGRWNPISYDENFFNILLEVLEQELFERPDKNLEKKEEVTQRIINLKKESEQAHQQQIEEKPSHDKAVFEDLDAKTPVVIEVEKDIQIGKAIKDKKETKPRKKSINPINKKKTRRQKRGKLQLLILFAVTGFALSLYFLIQPQFMGEDRVHLRAPLYTNQKTADSKDVASGLKRAILAFRKDSLKDYLVAQDALVEIVEKSNSLDAYAFLCMTYRELWPFSHQDAADQDALQIVLRRVQKINPKSPSANICLVVSYWNKGAYDDALRIMNNQLEISPGLIFFNQMTGDIYAARNDYRSASYYFAKVRELWSPPPVWSKAILQEARMYRKRAVYGSAVKLYRQLLKGNPNHSVARIELGIIEFEPYQNLSKAKDFIRSGLSSGQFIPKMIEAEAYVTLAKISILQGNNKQALKFAQQAFSADSSNQQSRELIMNMGGIKALNSVNIDNVNMVYLGEQYMKMNNYSAAQAEFRAAFEANKSNAFAALRAGEALWKLNQSNEAIAWIKKSIEADPNFIRSYLILSDYQSKRFDYLNAIETLKSSLRINRQHHGIFSGFALIELRRRNYEGAIRYAKKALELYDTDIDSIIILAKALLKKGAAEEAFQYIQQGLELDSSNEEIHITFAKILAALQGTDAGINYLDVLIGKYGKVIYMRALGELMAEEERYSEALKYYFQALEKNPKDKETLMSLGKILQSQKDYDRARDFLLEAATLDPSDAEPLFLIGQLYLDSGQYEFALKQFERVIVVNPNYPLSHYYAGLAQISLNNFDQALELAQKERIMNPEIPESYMLAAEAYYKKNQFGLCSEEYQKVLGKGLVIAEVYIKLARCYRLGGSFDSAMTMLSEAEKRESGNPDIYKELGALYHMQGSYIKAVESYKRYLQLTPQAKDKTFIEQQINKIENMGENDG
jgi:tetratricopeptide (TPR) repeat protein